MSAWTYEDRLRAAIESPYGRDLHRPDTRRIERPGWLQVITPSSPPGSTYLNEIILSDVPTSDAERVIDEAIATYHRDARPVKWCVGPWTGPVDFGRSLEQRGFVGSDVRGMGISTRARLPPARAEAGELTIELVTAASLDDYVATFLRGWDLPPGQAAIERHACEAAMSAAPVNAFFFLARRAGVPVGTAGLVVRGAYGYLLGAQVLPSARGLGAYQALIASRLALLAVRGIELAVTQARAATSAPILERLGFETLFHSKVYLLAPPQQVKP